MQQLLIPLGIIVAMSVLGYLMQMLKAATQRQQDRRLRERDQQRKAASAVKTESRDIDRFLRAVDAQRQRAVPTVRPLAPRPPAVPVAVPTVKPRKARLADAAPTDFPAAKPRGKMPAREADDLPVATVVSPVVPTGIPVAVVTKPARLAAMADARPAEPKTPFGAQLAGLLKGPNAAALAVALTEVLGPPKCRKRRWK